jgi:hypothetical protein
MLNHYYFCIPVTSSQALVIMLLLLLLQALNIFCFVRMYPAGGFTNFLQSNTSPENFHLVGNTRNRAESSPATPSLKRSLSVETGAQDKETINVDQDETNEDERKEKRLNWTKPEDVRLVIMSFLICEL